MIWIFVLWFLIGSITVAISHYFDNFKEKGEITLENVYKVFIGGILGPIVPLLFLIKFLNENGSDYVIYRRKDRKND